MSYQNLYKVSKATISLSQRSLTDKDFIGLINEEEGGIQIYINSKVASEVACYMAWENRSMGFDISDVDHEDYEGWASLGWDLDINTMDENLKINKKTSDNMIDIVINGHVIAKGYDGNHIDIYKSILKEWFENHIIA